MITLSYPTGCITSSVAALVFSLAMDSPANGQAIDPSAALQVPAVRAAISACLADRNRFCGNVVPGGGRIVQCLVGRRESLSLVCRDAIISARDALVAAGIPGAENLPR